MTTLSNLEENTHRSAWIQTNFYVLPMGDICRAGDYSMRWADAGDHHKKLSLDDRVNILIEAAEMLMREAGVVLHAGKTLPEARAKLVSTKGNAVLWFTKPA